MGKIIKEAFLLVDYNLSRYDEVKFMMAYVKDSYDLQTILIRNKPSDMDKTLADYVIDISPLDLDFVELSQAALLKLPVKVTSGIVFSDDAVAHGAQLLQCLGVHCDDGELANNAFCKYAYRNAEKKYAKELAARAL